VYDVTRRSTFQHLNQWLNEVDMYCRGHDAVKVLVGNKIDLVRRAFCDCAVHSPKVTSLTTRCDATRHQVDRVVKPSEAEAWARAHGMLFLEASAKTAEGVDQVFTEMTTKVHTPQLGHVTHRFDGMCF